MTDGGDREVDHALGDAAGGEEIAGQDKERNGQQDELLHGLKEFQRQGRHAVGREQQDREQRGKPERHRDRHANDKEHKQDDEEEGGRHRDTVVASGILSPVTSLMASAASSASS